MNPQTLTKWSIGSGFLGILLYLAALWALWGKHSISGKIGDKDFYYAGTGLLLIAIWFKLGAIYHKR